MTDSSTPEVVLDEPQQRRVLALKETKNVLTDGGSFLGGGTNRRETKDIIDVSEYILYGTGSEGTSIGNLYINVVPVIKGPKPSRAQRKRDAQRRSDARRHAGVGRD